MEDLLIQAYKMLISAASVPAPGQVELASDVQMIAAELKRCMKKYRLNSALSKAEQKLEADLA